MTFEIFTLGTLFILLNFLTDPTNYENSNIIIHIKNLNFNFPLHLQILVFFLLIFFLKTIINIFISWKRKQLHFKTKAEIGQTFLKDIFIYPEYFT